MQFIKPSYELVSIPDHPNNYNVGQFIERIGRLCYKSEDKITETSFVPFIQKLWKNQHYAMMEHFIFILDVSQLVYDDLINPKWNGHQFTEFANALRFIRATKTNRTEHDEYIVSGSLTSFFKALDALYNSGYKGSAGIVNICEFLDRDFRDILMTDRINTVLNNITNNHDIQNNITNDHDIQRITPIHGGFIFDIVSKNTMKYMDYGIRWMHDWYTVKFTVDRGVTHEIVRHRDASYAQESTRYCNYSKDKYGNEITFIEPLFYPEGNENRILWEDACVHVENSYIDLTEGNKQPAQYARTVLNNSVKADIFMTARIGEWQHFLKMRAANDAHPQMREVAVPLLNELCIKEPEMFKPVKEWLMMKGKI